MNDNSTYPTAEEIFASINPAQDVKFTISHCEFEEGMALYVNGTKIRSIGSNYSSGKECTAVKGDGDEITKITDTSSMTEAVVNPEQLYVDVIIPSGWTFTKGDIYKHCYIESLPRTTRGTFVGCTIHETTAQISDGYFTHCYFDGVPDIIDIPSVCKLIECINSNSNTVKHQAEVPGAVTLESVKTNPGKLKPANTKCKAYDFVNSFGTQLLYSDYIEPYSSSRRKEYARLQGSGTYAEMKTAMNSIQFTAGANITYDSYFMLEAADPTKYVRNSNKANSGDSYLVVVNGNGLRRKGYGNAPTEFGPVVGFSCGLATDTTDPEKFMEGEALVTFPRNANVDDITTWRHTYFGGNSCGVFGTEWNWVQYLSQRDYNFKFAVKQNHKLFSDAITGEAMDFTTTGDDIIWHWDVQFYDVTVDAEELVCDTPSIEFADTDAEPVVPHFNIDEHTSDDECTEFIAICSSDNPAVATVNGVNVQSEPAISGRGDLITITPVGEGSCNITVTLLHSGVSCVIPVTVGAN